MVEAEIIYKPYPAQKLLHECPYVEVLLEGNRGGGKSDAIIMEYLKNVGKGYGEAWAGVIFRREIFELHSLINKSRKYISQICPKAEFNISQRKWTFPDGETLIFQIAVNEEDYWKFHGHEYPYQAFDELSSWADGGFYMAMASCCRSSHAGIPRKRISTTNPWGAGHSWVKKRFIDPAARLQPITETYKNPFTDEDISMTRVTIHSDLSENAHLLENDPMYIAQLQSITNEAKRKAWVEGSWDIQVGAFFGDVWDMNNIIKPFTPPKHWLKWRSFDWGYAKPFSVGWSCMSDGTEAPDGKSYPRGTVIRYREWYGCEENESDVGLRLTVEDVARGILKREDEEISYSMADPAVFKEDGAESQAERFLKMGIAFERADNARIAGWDLMRERMKEKTFLVMNNCRDFIRTIPVLLHDTRKPEDLDTTMEDHIADEVRYGLMSRPWVKDKPNAGKAKETFADALKLIQKQRKDLY